MSAVLSRRAALSGAVASVAAVGAAAMPNDTAGIVGALTQSKIGSSVSPELLRLIERYQSANAAYDHVDETVATPANLRLSDAVKAARESVPHVEMSHDITGLPFASPGIQTSSTANLMDVIGAQVSAEMDRKPGDYTEAQLRYFDFHRAFHEARLERDRAVAVAVDEAERLYDTSAAIAQENAASDAYTAARVAVVDFQPRSLADLTAKLAFYAQSYSLPDHDDLLKQITIDVASVSTAGGAA